MYQFSFCESVGRSMGPLQRGNSLQSEASLGLADDECSSSASGIDLSVIDAASSCTIMSEIDAAALDSEPAGRSNEIPVECSPCRSIMSEIDAAVLDSEPAGRSYEISMECSTGRSTEILLDCSVSESGALSVASLFESDEEILEDQDFQVGRVHDVLPVIGRVGGGLPGAWQWPEVLFAIMTRLLPPEALAGFGIWSWVTWVEFTC